MHDCVVQGLLLARVAGVMAFISLDGLPPAAHRCSEEQAVTVGAPAAMVIVVVALALPR